MSKCRPRQIDEALDKIARESGLPSIGQMHLTMARQLLGDFTLNARQADRRLYGMDVGRCLQAVTDYLGQHPDQRQKVRGVFERIHDPHELPSGQPFDQIIAALEGDDRAAHRIYALFRTRALARKALTSR